MSDQTSLPYSLRDIVFVLVRLPFALILVPAALLATLFVLLGKAGHWLEDWCQDMTYALSTALHPRVWDKLKEWKRERDQFERDAAYWKSEALRKVEPPVVETPL